MIGSAIPALILGVLSASGPHVRVPQMVLSAGSGSAYWGNLLPGGLDGLTAGIGWFAVITSGARSR